VNDPQDRERREIQGQDLRKGIFWISMMVVVIALSRHLFSEEMTAWPMTASVPFRPLISRDEAERGRYFDTWPAIVDQVLHNRTDDADQEVQATDDGQLLFAVNEGSDSVAAFRILANGRLQRIGTYASHGDQPDSIGIAGNTLYVANRGNAGQAGPGTTTPNVTALSIGMDR